MSTVILNDRDYLSDTAELRLFRDIRESYRVAHQALVANDRKASALNLRKAITLTTSLLYEMADADRRLSDL